MKKELLSIGKISKMKAISIKTLHYYHKEGIFVPAYIDPKNGYRFYTTDQLFFLDLIKICRENRLRIKEIKELFERQDDRSIQNFLKMKTIEIQAEIRALQNRLSTISALTHTMVEDSITHEEKKYYQFYEKRYLLQLPINGLETDNNQPFEQLEKMMKQYKMNTTFRYGFVQPFASTSDEKNTDVFCEITKQDYLNNQDCPRLKILPEGSYLVKNCKEKTVHSERQLLFSSEEKDFAKENIYSFYLVKDVFQIENPPIQLQIYTGR